MVWVISGDRRSHGWFTAARRASNGSFFLVCLTVSIMCVTDGLDSTGTGWWVSGRIRVEVDQSLRFIMASEVGELHLELHFFTWFGALCFFRPISDDGISVVAGDHRGK